MDSDEDPIEEVVLPGDYNPTLVDGLAQDDEASDEDSADEDSPLTAEDGEFETGVCPTEGVKYFPKSTFPRATCQGTISQMCSSFNINIKMR